MKTFILITSTALMLFCGLSLVANAAELPEYMKDGTITVTLKDGKSYSFSTNTHMVVSRFALKNVVVEHSAEGVRKVYQSPAMAVAGPNAIKAFGGFGPTKLKVTPNAAGALVEQESGLVYGLGYSRQLNHRWSLEAVGLSNATGVLGAGYSF